MAQERKQWRGIDWLRGVAAFGIVGCHLDLGTVSPAAHLFLIYTNPNVGLFALIAGFFMAQQLEVKSMPFKEFARVRAFRLLPCYMLWTIFFLCFSEVFHAVAGKPVFSEITHWRWWVAVFAQGGASCHLWFLICLFYAQMVLFPVVAWPVNRLEAKGLFLCMMGVAGAFLCSMEVAPAWRWFMAYPLRLTSFLLIGAGISNLLPILVKIPKSVCFFMLVLGAVAMQLPWGSGFAKTLVVVVPAFLYALQVDVRSPRMVAFGKLLAGASMGVYLVHPLFTVFNWEVVRVLKLPGTLPVVMGDWIAAWACALAVVLVALRVPRIKKFFV